MEPGHFAAVSWIPHTTIQNTNEFRDTLTIYDAGNIQGFFIKEATGKTTWIVFQVDYRLIQEDGVIVEGRTVLQESEAPLHYMSIETYPMRLQSQGKLEKIWVLPQVQILLHLSEVPLFSPPQPPLLSQPPLLFHGSPRVLGELLSHGPPKSGSLKQADGQPSSQNKNTSSPKWKASPSSNPGNHAQPLLRAPKTQARHPQLSPPKHHTGRESSESPPWTTLVQQSPYSRPPPDLEEEHVGPASASLPQTNSQ